MSFWNIHNTLELLGLNDNEIKIYLEWLSLGQASASILGKNTKINRSTAQYTAENLVSKGLFAVKERKNTKIYTAEDPNELLLIINKEQEKLEEKRYHTQKAIASIREWMAPDTTDTDVKFYHGPEEVIELIDEIFHHNTPVYGFFPIKSDMHPIVKKYFDTTYRKKRDKYQLKIFAIINHKENHSDNFTQIDERNFKIFLKTHEEIFPFHGCVHIYNNRVAFYTYANSDVSGILIESPNLHKTMLSLFRLAWNYARALPENQLYKNIEI